MSCENAATWAAVVLVSVLLWSSPARAVEPDARAVEPDAGTAPPGVLRPPRLTRFVDATPPPGLAAPADVVLAIDVDDKGQVTAVEVARSAGTELDELALAAARQFTFEPGEFGDAPVAVRITYTYHFVPPPKPALPPPPSLLPPPSSPPPSPSPPSSSPPPPPPARYSSNVRGRRVPAEPVEHRLDREEIQRLPGTQGDALKAVQNLPGVARAPFGIGLLSVWGSAPRDTRVYLDGVSIPMLYHFGGLRSTMQSETVGTLAFVPGGFGVEHGLGVGGVIDVESRRPRTDGLHGHAQLDLVDGSLLLEGPLSPRLSFLVAARRSWVDALLPLFTTSNLQLSPAYWDYQARLAWRPTTGDQVDVAVLGADDTLDVVQNRGGGARATTSSTHIYFHRALLGWSRRLAGGGTFQLVSSLGYDVPFRFGIQYGGIPTTIDARTLSYGLRALARIPVASWLRLDGGVDYEGSRFAQDRAGVAQPPLGVAVGASVPGFGESTGDFGGMPSGYAADSLTLYANHVAPFLEARLSSPGGRLTVTPQIRLQVLTFAANPGTADASSRAYLSAEPRLSARLRLSPRLALQAAAGMYSQPPPPELMSPVFGNPRLAPERGTHFVLGADLDITPTLHVEAAGFWKQMRDLVVPGAEPGDPVAVNEGRGRAYGAELLVRQELSRGFFGWAAYTFSRSERQDHPGEAWHRYLFDQTHILTLLASRALPRGFEIGARYRYVTGNPYTPVVGAVFESNADKWRPVTGAPWGARLASFSQLDLRLDKRWTFDRWRLAAYLDVQNVLRSENPEAVQYNYDYSIKYPVNGLPLLPIVGVRGDF